MLILVPLFLSGQEIGKNPYQDIGIPYFKLDLYRSYQHEEAFIIAHKSISYNELTFMRNEEGYYARYRFTLFIFPEASDIAIGYIDREYDLQVKNYYEANDERKIDAHNYTVDISPGDYRIEAKIIDLNTDRQLMRKTEITIEDINENGLLLSDIVCYVIDTNTGEKSIFTDHKISRDRNDMEINIAYTTADKVSPVNFTIEHLDEDGKDYYSYDSTLTPGSQEKFTFPLKPDAFPRSRHLLKLSVDQEGKVHSVFKYLSFQWSGIPKTEFEMNDALKAMIHVAPKDSIAHYLDRDFLAKSHYFKRFWKTLDPTKETEKNELMTVYFDRVNIAIEEFSGYKLLGYKTDFGRIFIKYGQPDRVEYVSKDKSKGIWTNGLLWEYYELGKKFLFINGQLHPKYQIYEDK